MQLKPTDKPILNTKEAAALLGISLRVFYRLKKSRAFPLQPLPGTKARYSRAEVMAYADGALRSKRRAA